MLTTTSTKTFTLMLFVLSVNASQPLLGIQDEIQKQTQDWKLENINAAQQYEYFQFNGDENAPPAWKNGTIVGEPTGYIFKSRKARNSAICYGAAAAAITAGTLATVLSAGTLGAAMGSAYSIGYGALGAGVTAIEDNSRWNRRLIKYTFKKEINGKNRLFVKLEKFYQKPQYAILTRIIPDQNSQGNAKKIKFVFENLELENKDKEYGRVCDRWIYPNSKESLVFLQWLQYNHKDGKPFEQNTEYQVTVRQQKFGILTGNKAVTQNALQHLMEAIFDEILLVGESLELKLKIEQKDHRWSKWWNNSIFSSKGKKIGYYSLKNILNAFGLKECEQTLYEATPTIPVHVHH